MLGWDLQNYYSKQENFHDDLPYDLLNMVEMYKQISKQQVLPHFSEIKHGDRQSMINIRIFYQYFIIAIVDGVENGQESKTFKQFVSKYKHHMLDLDSTETKEFLEGQFRRLLEKRLEEQNKSMSEQTNHFGAIQKYNGHSDMASLQKQLKKKEQMSLKASIKQKLLKGNIHNSKHNRLHALLLHEILRIQISQELKAQC